MLGDWDLFGNHLLRRASGSASGPRQCVSEGDGEAGVGECTDWCPPRSVRHRGTVPAHTGRRGTLHTAHDLHVERGDV